MKFLISIAWNIVATGWARVGEEATVVLEPLRNLLNTGNVAIPVVAIHPGAEHPTRFGLHD